LFELRELYLDDNTITTLSYIEDLINLIRLHISNNKIQKVPALPKLTNLNVLNLSYNQLITADNLSILKNLKELDVSFNCIKSKEDFHTEISKLKKLAKVNSRGNFNSIDMNSYDSSLHINLKSYENNSRQPFTNNNEKLFKLTDTFDLDILKDSESRCGEFKSYRTEMNQYNNITPNISTENKEKTRNTYIKNIRSFDQSFNLLKEKSYKLSNRSKGNVNKTSEEDYIAHNVMDEYHTRSNYNKGSLSISDNTEAHTVLKKDIITEEFRKVFKEELNSLRDDLKLKLDKYKEAKSITGRTCESIGSVNKKCEENELKIIQIQNKVNKIAQKIKKDGKDKIKHKKQLQKSISELQCKVQSIENSSFINYSTHIKQPEEIIEQVFKVYSKGSDRISSNAINGLAKTLINKLEKKELSKSIADIIVDVTKVISKYGHITLPMLMAQCGMIHEVEGKSKTYVRRIEREVLKGGDIEKMKRVLVKLFDLYGLKISSVQWFDMLKKFKNREAKLVFYAGKCNIDINNIHPKDLTFSPSLVVALKEKRERKILMAIIQLGVFKQIIKELKFYEDTDCLYDTGKQIYLLKNPKQVHPLCLIQYY